MTATELTLLIMVIILTVGVAMALGWLSGRLDDLEKGTKAPRYTPPPDQTWYSHTETTKTKETPSYARPTERQPKRPR